MSAVSLTVNALLEDAGIGALVARRVVPYPIPLKMSLPAIAVAMNAEAETYLLAGASQYPETSVQIHCIATKAGEATDLGEAVKVALRDLHYTTGGADALFSKEPLDFTDFADDLSTHRRVMSFAVRWR
ncbi:DUF3168 domain-containing protein [Mesorhizobium waimense]|uniref:DUF3168 domain-containing protein n=1 Tax=Mesorhizobium waimense TaxID=1300307 RepID=A0A3A5KC66_9HYPH|nr:DUF3168 domain-containing protein [Mesorhizobium waimense]RJT32799.1 DUF3168 domain-containing protein [Mesorhizobium waimense]